MIKNRKKKISAIRRKQTGLRKKISSWPYQFINQFKASWKKRTSQCQATRTLAIQLVAGAALSISQNTLNSRHFRAEIFWNSTVHISPIVPIFVILFYSYIDIFDFAFERWIFRKHFLKRFLIKYVSKLLYPYV